MTTEDWKSGKEEDWNVGMLECWNVGASPSKSKETSAWGSDESGERSACGTHRQARADHNLIPTHSHTISSLLPPTDRLLWGELPAPSSGSRNSRLVAPAVLVTVHRFRGLRL